MKGMTMTEKIIAKHCGKDFVQAGMLVMADLDMILANDITAPLAIDEFVKCRYKKQKILHQKSVLNTFTISEFRV